MVYADAFAAPACDCTGSNATLSNCPVRPTGLAEGAQSAPRQALCSLRRADCACAESCDMLLNRTVGCLPERSVSKPSLLQYRQPHLERGCRSQHRQLRPASYNFSVQHKPCRVFRHGHGHGHGHKRECTCRATGSEGVTEHRSV